MAKSIKKRVSQRDIARILGINVSTVSRALNGLEGVSPALPPQAAFGQQVQECAWLGEPKWIG